MFCVTDGKLDVNMIDVRWWKACHKHYGKDSSVGTFSMCCVLLGKLMYEAQQACIDKAKYGCLKSDHCYNTLGNQFKENDNTVLYEETSVNDINLAVKVMEMKCCTEKQIIELCADLKFNLLNSEDLTLSALKRIKDKNVNIHHKINLSKAAENMNKNISKLSNKNDNVHMSSIIMAIMRK